MNWNQINDKSILKELCRRSKQRRLNLNIKQSDVARATGLNVQTIKNFESGKNVSLLVLIKILRVYRDLDALDKFLPEPGISPIQLLKLKGKQRERASGSLNNDQSKYEW